MKKSYLIILAMTTSALAIIVTPFSSWEQLIQSSPDIIVTRCSQTSTEKMFLAGDVSEIEIISILKGATNWGSEPLETPKIGPAKLDSPFFAPRQGEYYLIFSIHYNGVYQAIDKYRIVPLGLQFSTNMIVGHTLDEQVRSLLQRRLNDLNRQMKAEQEEKARLETVFQK